MRFVSKFMLNRFYHSQSSCCCLSCIRVRTRNNNTVSSIDGVNTCTLPVINELNFETDEGVANCNSGNAVSNGTFCRVPLEETNANNAPDCAAVNYAKASSAEALAEWQAELDQPYSDAWKCARLE